MASLERSLGEACDRLDALYRVRQRSARVLKPGTRWEEDCGNVIGRVAALVARGEAAEREQVFDLFAERRVLQVIAALGREGPVSVKQRVLRACALLAQNIRRQQALYLLGRYDVDARPPIHFSETAAVLGATDVASAGQRSVRAAPLHYTPAVRACSPAGMLSGLSSCFVRLASSWARRLRVAGVLAAGRGAHHRRWALVRFGG